MKKHKKKQEEDVIDIVKDSGKNFIKGMSKGLGLRSNKIGKSKKII